MYQIQTYFSPTFSFGFNLDSLFLVPGTCMAVQRALQGAVPVQNSLMDPCREAAQSVGLLLSGLMTVRMTWYHRKKKASQAC